MTLTIDCIDDTDVVRLGGDRLVYPDLADFTAAMASVAASGRRRLVLDLSQVSYLDSAAIGCLMDQYRQAESRGATLCLAGVQPRVQTMLTLTGAHHFLAMHPDASAAVAALKG